MSKLPSILMAAALTFATAGALAADDGAKTARKQAKETYNADRKACAPLQGDERKNCLHRAKAQYDQHRQSSAGDSRLPSPGAESDPSKPTAKHEPLSGMGKAPETASSPSASQ